MVKKVFMFPGQGSQKTGMGKELLSEFSDIVDQANDLLKPEREDFIPIQEICSSPKHVNLLNRTDFTQPILYLINAIHYQRMITLGKDGDVFIGHSLGEYNALHAAGAYDLLTGFRLVMKRGELMNQVQKGKMLAVLGLEDSIIEKIISRYQSPEKPVEIANYNSPGQVIISGFTSIIESLESVFKEAGARKVVWLPVSGAFHSSMMKAVANEFGEYLKNFTFSPLQKPAYANTTAQPYPYSSADSSQEVIPTYLTQQIYSSVQWTTEIQNIKKDYPNADFTEIGHGQVLTGLVKRIH